LLSPLISLEIPSHQRLVAAALVPRRSVYHQPPPFQSSTEIIPDARLAEGSSKIRSRGRGDDGAALFAPLVRATIAATTPRLSQRTGFNPNMARSNAI
jgi:hypothetical protein